MPSDGLQEIAALSDQRSRGAFLLRIVLWALALATLISVPQALQWYVNTEGRMSAGAGLKIALVHNWIYALQFPLIYLLMQRWMWTRGQRMVSTAVHLGGLLLFWLSHALLRALVLPLYRAGTEQKLPLSWTTLGSLLQSYVYESIWMYLSFVGVAFAILYSQRLRQNERRRWELQTRLAHSELQALKSQLEPHFLFNTLNSIYALMGHDPEVGRATVVRLSNLLRTSISHRSEDEVPLEREMQFIRDYLEIERTRVGNRLQLDFELDPLSLRALVPHLILQPLVENAVRHGIEPRDNGGQVTIRSLVEGDSVLLEVHNPISGRSGSESTGIGLRNISARLRTLYGPHGVIQFETRGGTARASIRLPFRPAQEEVEAHVDSYADRR